MMKFYCGIDLSARDCQVFVFDKQLQAMVQQKLPALLSKNMSLLRVRENL